ncbi:MAG: hypothetical protein V1820_03650 [archaeon]
MSGQSTRFPFLLVLLVFSVLAMPSLSPATALGKTAAFALLFLLGLRHPKARLVSIICIAFVQFLSMGGFSGGIPLVGDSPLQYAFFDGARKLFLSDDAYSNFRLISPVHINKFILTFISGVVSLFIPASGEFSWRLALFLAFASVPVSIVLSTRDKRASGFAAAVAWAVLQPHQQFIIGNYSVYLALAVSMPLLMGKRIGPVASFLLGGSAYLFHNGTFVSVAAVVFLRELVSRVFRRRSGTGGLASLAALVALPIMAFGAFLVFYSGLLSLPIAEVFSHFFQDLSLARPENSKTFVPNFLYQSSIAPILLFGGLLGAVSLVFSKRKSETVERYASFGVVLLLGALLNFSGSVYLEAFLGYYLVPVIWVGAALLVGELIPSQDGEKSAFLPATIVATLLFAVQFFFFVGALSGGPDSFGKALHYDFEKEHGKFPNAAVLSGRMEDSDSELLAWSVENAPPFPKKTSVIVDNSQRSGGFFLKLLQVRPAGEYYGVLYPVGRLQVEEAVEDEKDALEIAREFSFGNPGGAPQSGEKVAEFSDISVFDRNLRSLASEVGCSYRKSGGSILGKCNSTKGFFPLVYDPQISLSINGKAGNSARPGARGCGVYFEVAPGEEFELSFSYASAENRLWSSTFLLAASVAGFLPLLLA